MQHRWVFRPSPDRQLVENLSRSLNNLPFALSQALLLRGIHSFDEAKTFFRPSLSYLHDPFLMKDMGRAVDRIVRAKDKNEKVLVYGDYDVDGTTATALMTLFLQSIGIKASYWIPHRITHGYGLCETGIRAAVEQGAGIIVALDCGITAIEEARIASEHDVDLIICDHHTPGDAIPDAIAVLDPRRADCDYPFKELSGCGVGFKLIQAVLRELGLPEERAYDYLDLVAISTASDIVPLEGENRVLMIEGLKRLRSSPRTGIRSLAEIARIDMTNLSSRQIVFNIGPRVNAAGRLDEASYAVELLLSEKREDALKLAERLEIANNKRREMDKNTLDEAVRKAERQLSRDSQHSVVVHDEAWHPGIVGIVASRLVERFYRPSIMLTTVNGEVKGSARSIYGLNIYNALKECSELLTEFGGHDYAAGLSLKEKNLDAFKEHFNDTVGQRITPDLLTPVIHIDVSVNLEDLDDRFWAVLKQFSPFGPGNREPVFHVDNLMLARPPIRMGRDGTHIKFWVRQRDAGRKTVEVVGFGMHRYFELLQESVNKGLPVELLFSLSENTWNGVRSLQLKARDLRLQKSMIC